MKPDDDCPNAGCPGHLIVYTSKRRKTHQVQYLKCWFCNEQPAGNKVITPLSAIRRRRSRELPSEPA